MLLLLDTEIEPRSKNLLEVGLALGEETYRGLRPQQIEAFAQRARWVAGHNIVAHDLTVLREKMDVPALLRLPVIDTLSLSVLLRPDREKHRLDKDYHVLGLDKNDPVQDAKLAGELLDDLGQAWWELPEPLRQVYRHLLGNAAGFAGFWEWLGWRFGKPEPLAVGEAPLGQWLYANSRQFCRSVDLEKLAGEFPVETALVLAILRSSHPTIFTPSWLENRYPFIHTVYQQLRETPCSEPDCLWCRERLDPVKALGNYFRYPGFRKFEGDGEIPLQQQVVEAALRNDSFLAIFPTGGGKSLTFQLPALMRGEASGKLTVVISPLVALMKDQVDVLKDRFGVVNAVTINGMLSPLERSDAIRQVEEGIAHLLYISPESLRSATVLRMLRRRRIDRFVIDEAHCFSAWGQDFRVDYGFIGKFIRELQDFRMDGTTIPVSCFTATARPEVVQDIIGYFQKELSLPLQTFITREARKNLKYRVIPVKEKEEKFDQILRILEEVKKPVIIYVARVKTTAQLAEKLQGAGIAAAPYNGQMDANQKKQIQEDFKADRIRVIVATSAFGMGVDKDDVEMVIHYEVSNSLENYLQEAGRAGRDPKLEAQCVILFDQTDLDQHFLILQGGKISRKEINQVWGAIKNYRNDHITKSALELARAAGWDEEVKDLETRIRTAVNALEQAGYVERKLNSPRIFADSMLVENYAEGEQKIKANAHLFGEVLEDAFRVLKAIMGKSRRDGETRVDYLGDMLGIPPHRMAQILNSLAQAGCLGDLKDISAEVNLVNSKNNSERIARNFINLEQAWAEDLVGEHTQPFSVLESLREANDRLEGKELETGINQLRRILQSWELRGWIKKEREDRSEFAYRIRVNKDPVQFLNFVRERGKLAREVVEALGGMARSVRMRSGGEDAHIRLVEFSLVKMKAQVDSANIFGQDRDLDLYAAALLYLDLIGAIDLKKGFLVYFTRLKIDRLEDNKRKQYTTKNFTTLKEHYQQKVEQIHIVGAYARKMLENYQSALDFSHDYFTMDHEDFVARYFGSRKERRELKQPLTPEKFREIFGQLSTEQLEVVRDDSSPQILVAAGPGSGKTRVLVHKMASLLLLEDVQPQQFLMLAFSRPAAREFRSRLYGLVKGLARGVDIHTYHGFAFRLLGRIGNLERAQNIILDAKYAILEENVPMEKIKAKSVIMLDEFQDISRQEWEFLQAIVEKADNPRIIVAGDDDQSIYEFRGASLEFMQSIASKPDASTYYLTRNYRSAPNILAFCNQFLKYLPQNRIKAHQDLKAVPDRENGTLRLVKYQDTKLLEPLCQSVLAHAGQGTIGVLTGTNLEAEFTASRLLQLGVPAVLISDRQDFPLRGLEELVAFSGQVLGAAKINEGLIPDQDWSAARAALNRDFARSCNLALANRILDGFEKEFKHKFRIEWLEFLRTLRIEDFFSPEKGKVLVSTMHKAKGKEFDQVFLLLDAHRFEKPESYRAAYVGLTRAKEFLEIHTHYDLFDVFEAPEMEVVPHRGKVQGLETLRFTAAMEDVVLSHSLKPEVSAVNARLQAGAELKFKAGDKYHRLLVPGTWKLGVSLSAKGTQKLENYIRKGYRVESARVGYVVIWKPEDSDETGRVFLPEIELQKMEEATE